MAVRVAILHALFAIARTQDAQTRLPNVAYVGSGYNLLLGNPHSFNGKIDPGFEEPIFELTYRAQSRLGSWVVPDNTTGLEIHNCETNFGSSEITGMQSYTSSLEASVQADFDGWGAAFSASTSWKHVEQGTETQQTVYMQASATCSVYQVLANWFTPPKVTDSFANGISLLPTTYSSETAGAFHSFIQSFGTHVMFGIEFGGEYGKVSEFTQHSWNRLINDGIDVNAAASYSGVISAGGQVSVSTASSNAETYDDAASYHYVFTKGGSYSESEATWMSSVRSEPMPITYHLKPLDEVLESRFMPSSVDASTLAALPARQASLKTALASYCSFLLSQGYLSSCSSPGPNPTPMPVVNKSLPWANPSYLPASSSHAPVTYFTQNCPPQAYLTSIWWSNQPGFGLVSLKGTFSDGTSLRWGTNSNGAWNQELSCPHGFSRITGQYQSGYGIINAGTNCFAAGSCPTTRPSEASPFSFLDCSQDLTNTLHPEHMINSTAQCEAKGCCWSPSKQANVPRVCAESEGETCDCFGRVYFGKKFVQDKPGSGQTTTFEQMTSSNFNWYPRNGQVTCSNGDMGADPAPGYYKWCYCLESECLFRNNDVENSNQNFNGIRMGTQVCPWDAPVLVGFEILYQLGYGIVNYKPLCSNGNSFEQLRLQSLV